MLQQIYRKKIVICAMVGGQWVPNVAIILTRVGSNFSKNKYVLLHMKFHKLVWSQNSAYLHVYIQVVLGPDISYAISLQYLHLEKLFFLSKEQCFLVGVCVHKFISIKNKNLDIREANDSPFVAPTPKKPKSKIPRHTQLQQINMMLTPQSAYIVCIPSLRIIHTYKG